MIAPNMATMLAFFTTDAAVEPALLRRALVEAVGREPQPDHRRRRHLDQRLRRRAGERRAAGAARSTREGPDYDAFRGALTEAARQLARMLVRDGEGVTRVAEVRVEGARTAAEADRIARTVAESPLVKTALHGGDPNWGRVLAAVGRAGVPLDISRVSTLDRRRPRRARAAPRATTTRRRRRRRCRRTRCASASASARARPAGWMWTSDFSHGYVDINAHYRS